MASAPPAAPDAILWCSWCFKRSPMVMVDRRFFGRNLLRCTLCWRYGASCFKCGDGAARSQLDGETIDKLCACCQDAVRVWGEAPRLEEVSATGWCSYCLKKASFTLTQKNFVARNDYECDSCHRGACFCVNCGEAYTRGSAALCVKCEGSIGKWENYEENMKALLHGPAWCSWCIEFTAHRREESNAIRRHVYHCTSCKQRTLPCTTCEDGMAEGGPAWDDDLCERCRGRIVNWDDTRRRKEALLAQIRTKEQIMADMMRDSPERQRAAREGLLRPFLLLVSMSPVLRATAAAALGWNMLLTPSFGSAHEEAYSLLFEPRMGIQARAMGMMEKFASASHLVAWEGILRRTQQAVWHTLPDRRGEAEAEEALLLEVARTALQRLTPDQRRAIEERGEKQHTADLLRDASEAVMTRAELRTYAFEVCAAVLLSPENAVSAAATVAPVLMPMALGVTAVLSALAGPLALLGLGSLLYQGAKLVWGSSEPRLLVPLILALNQRIMLAAQGIHWTDALARTTPAPPPSLAPAAATAAVAPTTTVSTTAPAPVTDAAPPQP